MFRGPFALDSKFFSGSASIDAATAPQPVLPPTIPATNQPILAESHSPVPQPTSISTRAVSKRKLKDSHSDIDPGLSAPKLMHLSSPTPSSHPNIEKLFTDEISIGNNLKRRILRKNSKLEFNNAGSITGNTNSQQLKQLIKSKSEIAGQVIEMAMSLCETRQRMTQQSIDRGLPIKSKSSQDTGTSSATCENESTRPFNKQCLYLIPLLYYSHILKKKNLRSPHDINNIDRIFLPVLVRVVPETNPVEIVPDTSESEGYPGHWILLVATTKSKSEQVWVMDSLGGLPDNQLIEYAKNFRTWLGNNTTPPIDLSLFTLFKAEMPIQNYKSNDCGSAVIWAINELSQTYEPLLEPAEYPYTSFRETIFNCIVFFSTMTEANTIDDSNNESIEHDVIEIK